MLTSRRGLGAEQAFSWERSLCASWISPAGFCSVGLEMSPLNRVGFKESWRVCSRGMEAAAGGAWEPGLESTAGERGRRRGPNTAHLGPYRLFNLLSTTSRGREERASLMANSL